MSEEKRINSIKIIVTIIFIGLPILIMFYDVAIGGFFLVSGLYATNRAFRYLGNQHLQYNKINQLHNTNSAGKTILVQIVDDFERELPPKEIEKLLADAKSKADPKDIVIGVKFKIQDNKNE